MNNYTDKELADYFLETRRRNGSPSDKMYFQKYKWRLVLFFGFIAVLFGIGIYAQTWWLCGVIIGWVLGTISRDRSHAQQTRNLWPFYDKIIDWSKVSRIASGEQSI